MTMTDDLSELAEQVEREVSAAMRMPTLDAMRALLNESGIRRARVALAQAPDRLAEAQNAYREAQAVEGLARESYGQALAEADWELDGQVHTDGNKRYRWVPCECLAVSHDATNCPVCSGSGQVRRFMLADEVKTWKAAEAANHHAVVGPLGELRRAEEATAAARDALNVAEKRLSAAKYEVQAAIAELNALSVGLAAKGA